MMCRRLLSWVARIGLAMALIIAQLDQPALAGSTPLTKAQQAELEALISKAHAHRKAGEIMVAIGFLELALDISRDPYVLYNMAYLREVNKQFELAFDLYRQCLGKGVDAVIRDKARGRLARLENVLHLGRLMIELQPASAEVVIGGELQQPDADGVLVPEGQACSGSK